MSIYQRFKTKEVFIGDVPLGGKYPIRVQSMLNTNTMDTAACIKQSIALIEHGSAYVRITAPGIKEAENLVVIKNRLRHMGYKTPLIADVHFNPKIAEYCAQHVEKVRINPGNYADKRLFKQKEYTPNEYQAELERIAKRMAPLLKICMQYGTAIRIGTNHGSLSDRIINRYGDTPQGMVESTMEFLRICHQYGFDNIVVSLKASNPLIMMQANRLLVQQMIDESLCYPIHLGVTEAGQGEDGRIKSALGIGTLLKEGIGDTIRVSLTENPVNEIPFANILAEKINKQKNIKFFDASMKPIHKIDDVSLNNIMLCEEKKKASISLIKKTFAAITPYPCVVIKLNKINKTINNEIFSCYQNENVFKRHLTSPDIVHLLEASKENSYESAIRVIVAKEHTFFREVKKNDLTSSSLSDKEVVLMGSDGLEKMLNSFLNKKEPLDRGFNNIPVLALLKYNGCHFDAWLANSTILYGGLLHYKLIDGFYISTSAKYAKKVCDAVFGIMQAVRVRISKTEYISCPTCGRTTFDMEKTLTKIKEATQHLTGLKIGVMGCIVNGPGEMADADYGYVGNATGKVNLYKGKIAVKKNIEEQKALQELINILKSDGKWKEKM